MSRKFANKEILTALRAGNMSINQKINAFTALKDFRGLNESLRSINIVEEGYELQYHSTIEGKPMEGIEFIKNSNFFYGLAIEKIEFFRKYVNTFEEGNFKEVHVDWSTDHCLSNLEEPCHYDMVLINKRYWTFAPNITDIKEIAVMA